MSKDKWLNHFPTYKTGSLFGDMIDLIIDAVLAPIWLNGLLLELDESAYTVFFRLIYPKWLSLKRKNSYKYQYKTRQFRSYRQERFTLKDLGWRVVTV